jgi:hypothetical protein
VGLVLVKLRALAGQQYQRVGLLTVQVLQMENNEVFSFADLLLDRIFEYITIV